VLGTLPGCKNFDPSSPPERAPRPKAAAPRGSSQKAALDAGARHRQVSAAVKNQLARSEAQILRVPPLPTPRARIAFADDRLVRLTDDALLVSALPAQSEPDQSGKAKRFELEQPRQLAVLADGSVLAIGGQRTLLLARGAGEPKQIPRVSLLPGSRLYPELRWPGFSVLLPASGELLRYRLDQEEHDLPYLLPAASAARASLQDPICDLARNGTLICESGGQLFRWFPGSTPKSLGKLPPGHAVWRVLAGRRADRVTLIRSDGHSELYWLGPPLKNLGNFDLPWMPFEVVLCGKDYVELRLEESESQRRHWSVVVVDEHGEPLYQELLGADPDPTKTANWMATVVDWRDLASCRKRSWFAVREGKRVRVIDWRREATVLDEQP